MAMIVLRVGLTPLAFALVSQAQSRFGHWIGGRLLGLPLTTGPFLLTVCLTGSQATAAHAAAGVTGGQISVVACCCVYAWSARQLQPGSARAAALAVGFMAVAILNAVPVTWVCAIVAWTTIVMALVRWPWPARRLPAEATAASGSLAVRALLSTLIVLSTSTLVPILGGHVAGILSSAPVLLSIMLPGAHRSSGPEAAAAMARGTLVSMVATVGFSATLAAALPHMRTLPALLLAASVLLCLAVLTPLVERPLTRLKALSQTAGPDRAPALP